VYAECIATVANAKRTAEKSTAVEQNGTPQRGERQRT